MKDKLDFSELYNKLKSNNLTQAEYQEFLKYIEDVNHSDEVKSLLDNEALTYYQKSKNVPKSRFGVKWMMRAAAILLIFLAGSFVFNYFGSDNTVLYVTGNGETMEVYLPDSSRVALNANTRLEWRGDLAGNTRLVELEGEAYFDIVHTYDDRSFVVQTESSKITVLGTSFNVNSRITEDKIYLSEGSIQLEPSSPSKEEVVMMRPGQAAIVNPSSAKIEVMESVEIQNEVAWKDGLLRFSGLPLSIIIQRMEEIYGKEIRVSNPSVLDMEMEFTLPYGNWEVTSTAFALAADLEIIQHKDFVELR
ncbi:FecR family protein [Membranihabitans marinus]|uniref:FecR family protein n=1 Tax=Membranihabitans marinus TaxID=1227546 RepID=UPI001F3FE07A|nr:FecR domain-containing protein [Membranihabitans marinus]